MDLATARAEQRRAVAALRDCAAALEGGAPVNLALLAQARAASEMATAFLLRAGSDAKARYLRRQELIGKAGNDAAADHEFGRAAAAHKAMADALAAIELTEAAEGNS